MSTEQNYVGKVDSANSLDSTAENANQAAQNEAQHNSDADQASDEIPQEEPDAFFLRVANNCEVSGHLEEIIKSAENLWWNKEAIPTILEMCNTWLADSDGVKVGRKAKVQRMLDLVRITIELTERYGHFDNAMEEDKRDQVADKLKW